MDNNMPEKSNSILVFTKTTRLVWTKCLHELFLVCVEELGGAAKASPLKIKNLMTKRHSECQTLTLNQIKSYLQSHRKFLTQSTLNLIEKDLTGELTPKMINSFKRKQKYYNNSATFKYSIDNVNKISNDNLLGVPPPALVSEPLLLQSNYLDTNKLSFTYDYTQYYDKLINYITKSNTYPTQLTNEETINCPILDNLWCNESFEN